MSGRPVPLGNHDAQSVPCDEGNETLPRVRNDASGNDAMTLPDGSLMDAKNTNQLYPSSTGGSSGTETTLQEVDQAQGLSSVDDETHDGLSDGPVPDEATEEKELPLVTPDTPQTPMPPVLAPTATVVATRVPEATDIVVASPLTLVRSTTEASEREWLGTRRRWMVFGVIAMLAVVLLASVGLVWRNQSTHATPLPKLGPRERAAAVVAYVNQISFLNQTIRSPLEIAAVLADMNHSNGNSSLQAYSASPEEAAVQWLVDVDPLQLVPDSPSRQFRIRQRYALRILWFQQAHHGTNANTATALVPHWKETAGWITNDEDECNWYGITCEETDLGHDVGVQHVVTEFIFGIHFALEQPRRDDSSRLWTLDGSPNLLRTRQFPVGNLARVDRSMDQPSHTGHIRQSARGYLAIYHWSMESHQSGLYSQQCPRGSTPRVHWSLDRR